MKELGLVLMSLASMYVTLMYVMLPLARVVRDSPRGSGQEFLALLGIVIIGYLCRRRKYW